MRKIIWICLSLAFFNSVRSEKEPEIPDQQPELPEETNQYKQFVFQYRNGIENPYRKKLFMARYRNVMNHNERLKKNEELYEMGVNNFTDWVIFILTGYFVF